MTGDFEWLVEQSEFFLPSGNTNDEVAYFLESLAESIRQGREIEEESSITVFPPKEQHNDDEEDEGEEEVEDDEDGDE